jgi:hypothetical protein
MNEARGKSGMNRVSIPCTHREKQSMKVNAKFALNPCHYFPERDSHVIARHCRCLFCRVQYVCVCYVCMGAFSDPVKRFNSTILPGAM